MYEVAGTDLVAKVYHKPPTAVHADKLRSMVALSQKEIGAIAAWPTAVLSERPGGPVVGLAMRKVKGFKEIHTLYSPAHRKSEFPKADWKFLIHVAANCAAAFDTIHTHGVVMGDVNQANVLVAESGLVTLIDCDSFQIQSAGRTYPCEVGVPLFTPPELIGRSFRGVTRTVEHDRFGLAVLVFHLLMMGRHPFSGRYTGPGDMPIERAIEEFRFAYSASARNFQMQPPLHALTLSALPPPIGSMFEQAFGSQPPARGRPAASDWHQQLTAFKGTLRQCSRDSGHQTPSHLPGCVWCELMKQGAPNFFVSVAFAAAVGPKATPTFVLATVWTRIDAIPRPTLGYKQLVMPAGKTPVPWPAHLLSRIPPQPLPPAILSTQHEPPEPVLPPARYAKAVVPYSPKQRTVGYTFVVLLGLAYVCIFIGPVLGAALAINSKLAAILLVGTDLVLALAAAIWWLVLEQGRRTEQVNRNRLYRAERHERRRLAEEQLEAWQQELDKRLEAARREYRAVLQRWEQLVAPVRQEAERRRTAHAEMSRAVDHAQAFWVGRVNQFMAEFDRKKSELSAHRAHHTELTTRLEAERRQLLARAQDIQRAEFLEKHYIDDASIPDIGPTRKATLVSFGIETAADVSEDAILDIPGFGDKLTSRLVEWRAKIESRFRFNATVGIPAHEYQAIELKNFQLRQPVETKLLDGERELSEIARRTREEFLAFQHRIGPLLEALAQTLADVSAIPPGI